MSHVQIPVAGTIPGKKALQAERLDTRIAELDLAHVIEVARLNASIESAKQKFFLSKLQGA
jgi:hypothetical protein